MYPVFSVYPVCPHLASKSFRKNVLIWQLFVLDWHWKFYSDLAGDLKTEKIFVPIWLWESSILYPVYPVSSVSCIQYPVSRVSCTYSLSCIILVSMYPLIQSISYLTIYLPRPQITEGRWFDHALLSLLIFSILTSRVRNQDKITIHTGWNNRTYRVK